MAATVKVTVSMPADLHDALVTLTGSGAFSHTVQQACRAWVDAQWWDIVERASERSFS